MTFSFISGVFFYFRNFTNDSFSYDFFVYLGLLNLNLFALRDSDIISFLKYIMYIFLVSFYHLITTSFRDAAESNKTINNKQKKGRKFCA